MKTSLPLAGIMVAGLALFPACQTKEDIRREQEMQRLQTTMQEERSQLETSSEELKVEVSRLNSLFEELYQQSQALRTEVASLSERVKTLEAAPPAASAAEEPEERAEEKAPPSLQRGKALFDAGKFEEAAETLKQVLAGKPKASDAKEARYLLAESYFGGKDYGVAALEFSQFRKEWPTDSRVPKAIYRQATSFRNLKKNKEARLFYQELIDKFPKATFAAQAKKDLKALK